jgi:hypothetical protein
MTQVKAKIINYNHNSSFTVLDTVITIVNYDRKMFYGTGLGNFWMQVCDD